MAEVLSQAQIDALLNSMQSGEETVTKPESKEEANWGKYDFYSPKKFSKDRLKILKGLFDNYARLVGLHLNGLFRSIAEIEVLSIEEQRYAELDNTLSENDVITVGIIKSESGRKYPSVFHINKQSNLKMIDRMLGATNVSNVDVRESYAYSDIELQLYAKIMESITGVLENIWANYEKIKVDSIRVETNPGLFQDIRIDEEVLIVFLNMKIGEIEGDITVCLPSRMITSILENVDRHSIIDDDDELGYIASGREEILSRLRKSPIEMRGILAQTQLTTQQLYDLQIGDVLELNIPKDSSITMLVEDEPLYEGALGVYKQNTAVQINKFFNDNGK